MSATGSAGSTVQSDEERSAYTNTNTMQRSLFKEGECWVSPGIRFHFLLNGVLRCGHQAFFPPLKRQALVEFVSAFCFAGRRCETPLPVKIVLVYAPPRKVGTHEKCTRLVY